MNVKHRADYRFRPASLIRGGVIAIALVALCSAVGVAQEQTDEQSIRILSPNGGEELTAGQTWTIRWKADVGADALDIMVWNGNTGTWTTIGSYVPAYSGSYDWTVPAGLQGQTFRLRIQSLRFEDAERYGAAFFSVERKENAVSSADEPTHHGTVRGTNELVQVRPNPASDRIEIDGTGVEIRDIRVVDVRTGETVTAIAVDNAGTVSVPTLGYPSGSYLVRVFLSDGTEVARKVIVKR